MNTIIKLIIVCISCMHTTPAWAKIQFRNRVSITAYKIDPATHNQTWSIQTTNSRQRGCRAEIILSSSIVRDSIANLFLLKNYDTYVFVYKNPQAAEDPIVSTITPAQIKAAGNNPIIIINTNGTASITARATYESIMKKQNRSLSSSVQQKR